MIAGAGACGLAAAAQNDPAEDELVFGDGRDKADYYGLAIPPDGRWLGISVTAGTARGSDIWLADLTEGGPVGARLRQLSTAARGRTVPYLRGRLGPDDDICVYTEDGADFGRIAVTTPNGLDGETGVSWCPSSHRPC